MRNLSIILAFLMFSLTTFSQVTIGASNKPESFSILQLEGGNGGVRFPQLTTIERDALSTEGNVKAAGLVIYNIDKKVLEFWDGTKWTTFTSSTTDIPNIVGQNGIGTTVDTITNQVNVSLGGQFTSTRTLDLNGSNLELTTNEGQLKINGNYADNLPALNVEGKVRITKPEPLPVGGSTLVIDDDGNIGIESIKNKISLVFFAQSKSKQEYNKIYTDDSFNGDTEVGKIVRWSPTDIVYNNANLAKFSEEDVPLDTNETAQSDKNAIKTDFIMQQDGEYEVTGFISYRPNAVIYNTDQDSAVLNVTIEVSQDGGTTWREITLNRTIWSGGFNRVQTLLIPPAVVNLKKGDRVHMSFYNPFKSDSALPQGQLVNWGISAPTGGTYSKAIRITAL